MTTSSLSNQPINQNLYETDFYIWIETTIKDLKDGNFTNLDRNNLIEELESMGRSEKREIKNRLIVLLTHLLKWNYQVEQRSQSWLNTIKEQRRQIIFLLEDSPSLKLYYQSILTRCYDLARQDAASETRLSLNTFPLESPFTEDEILTKDYLSD
ncbi:DUF29 domain-containing protein [Aphanothece hegewaldii CCALA 016]|uniref:DUF29 domain-containing protein n=1 Tax=Aphanothece hegewaldii CCALA 016 TaxID=2107694 RepID=A0A2T1LZW8_9CHRO|nr:DUF29 domain-containing protein [Aphanothece hegewaldii]PSF37969.1 DUF29 domain-containing protein [Aphanothece hegewaldii CCALA 016]